MIKHNQDGAVSGLLVSFVLTVLLLLGALGFAGWAYTERQDYKNNVESKIDTAVEAANRELSIAKDKEFAEKAKLPLEHYSGPEASGSLSIDYPKTWSAYVDDSGSGAGNALLNGYFAPGVVPSVSGKESVFALRVQLVNQSYGQVLQSLARNQQEGKLAINAYALPKLPDLVGVKVNGEVSQLREKTVTMVVLPLRSQTLQIWTEGTQYLDDFNNHVLPNFSFAP